MLTWFQFFSISLFVLGAVFCTLRLRSGTDLITCESELHGWVSRMACSILSPIGSSVELSFDFCGSNLFFGFWGENNLARRNKVSRRKNTVRMKRIARRNVRQETRSVIVRGALVAGKCITERKRSKVWAGQRRIIVLNLATSKMPPLAPLLPVAILKAKTRPRNLFHLPLLLWLLGSK